MRDEAVAALLVVALLAGAGIGYFVGDSGVRPKSNSTSGSCSGTSVEFQAIPVNFTHMPVLLMRPNTAAVVCVTYRDEWDGNATKFSYEPDSFQNSPFYFPTGIAKAACIYTPQSTGCFYNDSHSFNVVAFPSPIRPTGSVAEVTITYYVFSLPNSTGFYDHTFIISCETPRLAVGYSAQQVNSSDFATIPVHSCFNAPYVPISIAVSGMNVTYVGVNTGPKV